MADAPPPPLVTAQGAPFTPPPPPPVPSLLDRHGVDAKFMLQGFVLICSLIGGIIGVYITIENRVAVQSERITILQQQLTEILKAQAHNIDEQKALSRDVGQSLTKLTEQMADLRVALAGVAALAPERQQRGR